MRGQGVDCNRVAEDTDACNLNVPEVAINTQERQTEQINVIPACIAVLPEVAINTQQRQNGQEIMEVDACITSVPEVAINTEQRKEEWEVFPSFFMKWEERRSWKP